MYDNYLAHYGVKGMKWGVRHDTPRVGVKRKTSSKKSKLTPKQKKILMYGAIGVGAVLAAYGGYKIYGARVASNTRHNKVLAESILKVSGDHLTSSLNEAQDLKRRNFPDSIQKTAWNNVDAAHNTHKAAKQIAENILTQKRRVKDDEAWGAFEKAYLATNDFSLIPKMRGLNNKK